MTSAVYTITHLPTNRIYVGSAVNVAKRWREHVRNLRSGRGSRYLQRAWDRHGEHEFAFDVVVICDKHDLIRTEQMMMDALRSWDARYGFNHVPTAGSQLGLRHTDEARAKISKAGKGKTRSPETRAKIAAAKRGKKRPQWLVDKMKRERTGKPNLKLRGRIRAPEHCAAISAARRGKPLTEAHKQKIAAGMAGNTNGANSVHTEAHKRKISEGLKRAYAVGRREKRQPTATT